MDYYLRRRHRQVHVHVNSSKNISLNESCELTDEGLLKYYNIIIIMTRVHSRNPQDLKYH